MGYVYILENPAMPDLIKIGYTTRTVEDRAIELYQGATGIPQPFVVAYKEACENPKKLEAAVHKKLSYYRVNKNREFFMYPVDAAAQVVQELHRFQNTSWWRRWTSHFLTRFNKKVEDIEKVEA